MGETFFICDTHFDHRGIITFSGTKPFCPFATIIEACVEDAIARQQKRHAREDCVKVMERAIISCYPSPGPYAAAEAALDAALASGYVITSRP